MACGCNSIPSSCTTSKRSKRPARFLESEGRQGATAASAKAAYHKLALRHHPDKNRGKEEEAKGKFQQVSAAYSVVDAYISNHHNTTTPATEPSTAFRSNSNTESSWEEARSVFREAFGFDFEDAASAVFRNAFGVGFEEVTNYATNLVHSATAASSRRASLQIRSNEHAVHQCRVEMNQRQQNLSASQAALNHVVRGHNAFLLNPQIHPENSLWEGWYFSATGLLLCHPAMERPIFALLGAILVPLTVNGIGWCARYYEVYTEQNHKWEHRIEQASQTVQQEMSLLEEARRRLIRAESPVSQSLRIAGAFLGFG